jgi:hypothetical protein
MGNCNLPLPCASTTASLTSPALSITNVGGNDGVAGESHAVGTGRIQLSGNGVSGYSDYASGVIGYSDKGGNGVVGTAENGGNGVYAESYSGGNGVYGYSESHGGYGVLGENAFTAGVVGFSQNVGVCNGSSGVGVAGFGGSRTSNNGVLGDSGMGTGVIGHSISGVGVSAASDTGIALIATAGGGQCALFQNGDVEVLSGNLIAHLELRSKGDLVVENTGKFEGTLLATSFFCPLKFFRIDHPLDPANKYLVHASVESSDRKNLYDGTVRLDKKGEAIVDVPEWFEALNGDFRYQLTSVGAAAPNLHVAKELSKGNFKISGGRPGTRVSWQITGIRRDAMARYEPMEVEQDKPEHERGYYQNPEAHGQPREKGITAIGARDARLGVRSFTPPPIPRPPARPVRPEIRRSGMRKGGNVDRGAIRGEKRRTTKSSKKGR